MMDTLKADFIALALAVVAFRVDAQNIDTSPTELVSVNISDHQLLRDLSRALRVEAALVPVTVQVPIRLGAQVCGMKVKDLRQNAIGDPVNCDATTSSPAFRTAVEAQLLTE